MAYVPGYEYDIFISYANVDNEPDPGVERGWISTLLEGLENRLKQQTECREKCEVWFDKRLGGNEPLTDSIFGSLEKTAVLVVVLSRAYLKSDWCKRERAKFLDMIKSRTGKGRRVFLVELDKVEIRDRPDGFRDCKGYQFWTLDRERNRPRRLGVPQPSLEDRDYWSRVDDLGYELAAELDRVRRESDLAGQQQAAATVRDTRTSVFLAEPEQDVVTERNAVKRTLDQAGFRILPDDNQKPYPRAATQWEAAVKEDLKKCDLFVQLLSERDGKIAFLSDMPQGFVQAQYDWARDSGVEIVQWRNRELDVDSIGDPDHQQLLLQETVQAVGLEEFKRTVESKLNVAEKVPMATSSVPAWVYIDADEKDEDLSDAIVDMLERRQPPAGYDLDEPEDLNKEESLEYVKKCWDGIIFVYGQGDVGRLGRRIRKWSKLSSQIERDPPLKLGLYLGPPLEKARLRVKPPALIQIDGRKALNESELAKFINVIGRSKSKQPAEPLAPRATVPT